MLLWISVDGLRPELINVTRKEEKFGHLVKVGVEVKVIWQ